MYIEPNSQIRLLHNVPLDNTYEHTIYFANATAQYNYFSGKLKTGGQFSNVSYTRTERGVLRLEGTADNFYDCNYIMFQNTSFGSKWFYAFIKKAPEYVSNGVFKIEFEMDDMQTWMFDYTVDACFVEREHALTDNPGDNIIAEPIDIGDITCNNVSGTGKFSSYVAVIASAYNPNGQAGGTLGGLATGVHYTPCLINSQTEVQTFLDLLDAITQANKQESVVSIFYMPSNFYPTGENADMPVVDVAVVAKNTTIHGYTPRNKKLLTYPYNYLAVDCGTNDATYRYEWFSTDNCNFEMVGTVSCNPQVALVPQNYNGVSGDSFNYCEKLVMTGFPQVPWSIDSFKAWIAQEGSATALQGVASAFTIASGAVTGNLGAVASGSISMANTANNIMKAYNRPDQAKGTSSGDIDVATRTKDFYFKQMQVSLSNAKIIDDFFDRFGYNTCRNKVPNTHSRPHWNYVKTRNCTITGSIPTDSASKICSIFNNGVTFWKNGDEVGNYSLNNSVS